MTMSTMSCRIQLDADLAGWVWSKLHLENLSDQTHAQLTWSKWLQLLLDIKSHLTQSRNLPHPQVQKLAVEERKKNFVDKGKTHQDTNT